MSALTRCRFGTDTLPISLLAQAPGVLRVWCLEARNLKNVGSITDLKIDPYMRVARQAQGQPTPGKPASWPKEQRTRTAVDAGLACTWNQPVDIEWTESDVAFAASGQNPGFLHLAVFDSDVFNDDLIGTPGYLPPAAAVSPPEHPTPLSSRVWNVFNPLRAFFCASDAAPRCARRH